MSSACRLLVLLLALYCKEVVSELTAEKEGEIGSKAAMRIYRSPSSGAWAGQNSDPTDKLEHSLGQQILVEDDVADLVTSGSFSASLGFWEHSAKRAGARKLQCHSGGTDYDNCLNCAGSFYSSSCNSCYDCTICNFCRGDPDSDTDSDTDSDSDDAGSGSDYDDTGSSRSPTAATDSPTISPMTIFPTAAP
ncbi:hypothetical protein CYMTET_19532, partial [Cymbomonas tetramitiformis]